MARVGRPVVLVLAVLLLLPGVPAWAAPPVWESRVVQTSAGELVPGLRNSAGAPGEVYQFLTRVTAPNGQVATAFDIVNGSAWTSRAYPSAFEGAPALMPGTYLVEFVVNESVVRREQVTVGLTPFAPACAGDEQLSFSPPAPAVNQPFTILATSARPASDVALAGPGSPQFLGSSPGGRGILWAFRATVGQPGQATYSFSVAGSVCVSGTVLIGGAGGTPPPNAAWQFDYPAVVRLSEHNSFELRLRNQNGLAGQQTVLQVSVAAPNGAAYTAPLLVNGDQWAPVRYPFNFPQAPPLQAGTYRFEWRFANGMPLAADQLRVVP
ncbi:MAG: hypothetical protein KatS3mg061_2685 [Dehalococcoidia bacterium]|nr:MAG: hypothetical protein KatS3mg061_2685 [Dehalococcoidia bacterium]